MLTLKNEKEVVGIRSIIIIKPELFYENSSSHSDIPLRAVMNFGDSPVPRAPHSE